MYFILVGEKGQLPRGLFLEGLSEEATCSWEQPPDGVRLGVVSCSLCLRTGGPVHLSAGARGAAEASPLLGLGRSGSGSGSELLLAAEENQVIDRCNDT